MNLDDTIALVRSRVNATRLGKSTWREADRDVLALRAALAALEDARTAQASGDDEWEYVHHTTSRIPYTEWQTIMALRELHATHRRRRASPWVPVPPDTYPATHVSISTDPDPNR